MQTAADAGVARPVRRLGESYGAPRGAHEHRVPVAHALAWPGERRRAFKRCNLLQTTHPSSLQTLGSATRPPRCSSGTWGVARWRYRPARTCRGGTWSTPPRRSRRGTLRLGGRMAGSGPGQIMRCSLLSTRLCAAAEMLRGQARGRAAVKQRSGTQLRQTGRAHALRAPRSPLQSDALTELVPRVPRLLGHALHSGVASLALPPAENVP